jgi:hypothetical protein
MFDDVRRFTWNFIQKSLILFNFEEFIKVMNEHMEEKNVKKFPSQCKALPTHINNKSSNYHFVYRAKRETNLMYIANIANYSYFIELTLLSEEKENKLLNNHVAPFFLLEFLQLLKSLPQIL